MSRIFLFPHFWGAFLFFGRAIKSARSVGRWVEQQRRNGEGNVSSCEPCACGGGGQPSGWQDFFFHPSVMLIAVSCGGGGGHYGEERDGEKAQKAPDEHKTVGLFTDDYPHCIT